METRIQNLQHHIAWIESLLADSSGTVEVESMMKPMEMREKTAGMSLEQISATRQWKSLSQKAKLVLTLWFRFADRSLIESVETVHPELTPEVQRQVAENLSVNPDVKRIIRLFFGKAQL